MRNVCLLFTAGLWLICSTAQAQTSYGNLNQGNAGNGGNIGNSYFGYEAGLNNTAFRNTFIGYNSGIGNTIGEDNIFVGYNSGVNNIGGNHNVFMGRSAGYNNIDGNSNTFIGHRSGYNNQTGAQNVFLGYYSGHNNTDGEQNTFVGYRSGHNSQTGSGNVFLGYNAGSHEMDSNLLYIDNSNTPEPLIWGDFDANALRFNGIVGIGNIPQDNTLTRILVADPVGNLNWRAVSSLEADAHGFPSYPASAGDSGSTTNSFFGHLTGAVTTGADNTLVGYQSGLNTTTGYEKQPGFAYPGE